MNTFAIWLGIGASTWLFLEYVLHRFVGHGKKARVAFAREHRRHHALGDYFAPASKKAMLAIPIIGSFGALLSWPFGFDRGAAFVAGLSLMYLAYEIFHRRLHTHPPSGPFGRWARRNHFHHHFMAPDTNHGVTTPVFDWVFRTQAPRTVIDVPEKLAMVWLRDPATGDVHTDFATDYRLGALKATSSAVRSDRFAATVS